MPGTFNIYCDESCHLEHDGIPIMVLGAVWCNIDRVHEASRRLREIKEIRRRADAGGRPAYSPTFECKWSKVSASGLSYYRDVIDYFFDDDDLRFRGVLIDKSLLDHAAFDQTHDEWYYKMMFTMLEPIIDPGNQHNVYLDIKDTKSEERRAKLEEVLRNSRHDRAGRIIRRVQQIRSHESELLQVADLLLGAIAYHNRVEMGDLPRLGEQLNQGKLQLIRRIQSRSGKSLTGTTWLLEPKLNLLRWCPRDD